VQCSAAVKEALADLDAATHFSEHFSGDIQPILHEWANGKSPTLQGAMVALPLIAQETCSHINATETSVQKSVAPILQSIEPK